MDRDMRMEVGKNSKIKLVKENKCVSFSMWFINGAINFDWKLLHERFNFVKNTALLPCMKSRLEGKILRAIHYFQICNAYRCTKRLQLCEKANRYINLLNEEIGYTHNVFENSKTFTNYTNIDNLGHILISMFFKLCIML